MFNFIVLSQMTLRQDMTVYIESTGGYTKMAATYYKNKAAGSYALYIGIKKQNTERLKRQLIFDCIA